jgi:hypothetical protein
LTLSIGYSIFILAIVFLLIVFKKVSPDLFLASDDYYIMGKEFFYNGSSLFHHFRAPLLPLLLSILNFFSLDFQPYVRVLMTLTFVYANTILAQKIFESFLSNKHIFIGLFIALFNPLHIHWTLKCTPEIYITTFLGLIIYCLIKYLKTEKWYYIILLFMLIFLATNLKPVFPFISITILLISMASRRMKFIILSIGFVLFSIITQLTVMAYTKTLSDPKYQYGKSDLIGNYFLVPAMLEARRFEFGSNEKLIINNPEKSVYAIGTKNYTLWCDNYYLSHPDASTYQMVFDFVKDNPGKVIVTKILSPIFFISLASSSTETISNLIINLSVIILSIVGLRTIFKDNTRKILIILSVLIGYYLTYLVAFSYARYSVPVMFYLSIPVGISISILYHKIKIIFIRKII